MLISYGRLTFTNVVIRIPQSSTFAPEPATYPRGGAGFFVFERNFLWDPWMARDACFQETSISFTYLRTLNGGSLPNLPIIG